MDRFGRFKLDIDDAHRLTKVTIEDDKINNILKPILWPNYPSWLLLELDYDTISYEIITEKTKVLPVTARDLIVSNKELLRQLDDQKWREQFIKLR